ncbi:MAG: hypothetical protein II936_07230, partial [Oscillospiraceae bacterium]|nr:hypothetical protein [Oscillospiraceae bacterium]
IQKLFFGTYCYPTAGYVKAPMTVFEMRNMESNCDTPSVLTDDFSTGDGTYVSGGGKIFWYGSVFCKQFTSEANKVGLVYIPNGGGSGGSSTPPGDPLYKWPGQYYIYD